MTHPWFRAAAPRVLAHRGLARPGDPWAENSIAAVIAAASAGVSYVESDCHLSRDGEVVLFHDVSVARVTGEHRLVADLTARELEALMADRGGLLTLAAALDAFPQLCWNLDVKAARAAVPTGVLAAPHADRVLLTSFSDRRRRRALRAAADAGAALRPATSAGRATIARLLAATAAGSSRLAARALAGVDAVQIPERQGAVRVLSPRLLRFVHRAGAEVHVWTVNDPERMRELVALGVDGVVTDQADLALAVLS